MACKTAPSGSLFPVGTIRNAVCATCGKPLRYTKTGLWVHRKER